MTQKKKKLHRKAISWRRTGKNRRVKHKKPVRVINRQLDLTWNDRATMAGNYAKLGLSAADKGHTHVTEHRETPVILGEDDFGDADELMQSFEDGKEAGGRGEALPALESAGASKVVRRSKKSEERAKMNQVMSLDAQVYWSTLLAKHGSDYHAMQLDSKLNPRQCGEKECKRMCERYMTECAAPAVKHN